MSKDMMSYLHGNDVDLQREGAFQAAENRAEEAVPQLVALLRSPNSGRAGSRRRPRVAQNRRAQGRGKRAAFAARR